MLAGLEERLDEFDHLLNNYARMMLEIPEEGPPPSPQPLVKPEFPKSMRKPEDLPRSVDRGNFDLHIDSLTFIAVV